MEIQIISSVSKLLSLHVANKIAFYITTSLLFGIWFLLRHHVDVPNEPHYFPPFGIIWYNAKKEDPHNKLNKATLIVHIIGVILSLQDLFLNFYN